MSWKVLRGGSMLAPSAWLPLPAKLAAPAAGRQAARPRRRGRAMEGPKNANSHPTCLRHRAHHIESSAWRREGLTLPSQSTPSNGFLERSGDTSHAPSFCVGSYTLSVSVSCMAETGEGHFVSGREMKAVGGFFFFVLLSFSANPHPSTFCSGHVDRCYRTGEGHGHVLHVACRQKPTAKEEQKK